ncbi:MAG: hypothetical protein ACI83L_001709 [Cryomorphaceae bacterium]|jgi:hypothetical protein
MPKKFICLNKKIGDVLQGCCSVKLPFAAKQVLSAARVLHLVFPAKANVVFVAAAIRLNLRRTESNKASLHKRDRRISGIFFSAC